MVGFIKDEVEEQSEKKAQVEIKDVQDFRNYNVTAAKSGSLFWFSPRARRPGDGSEYVSAPR